MINKSVQNIFVTQLFVSYLQDLKVCDDIETELKTLRSNKQGYEKKNNWQSFDNLHELDSFKNLTDMFLQESASVFDAMRVSRDSIYINNMWAQITTHANNHDVHIHPNSYLSGLLYVKTPPACGETLLFNPTMRDLMIQPEVEEFNSANAPKWVVQPERGKLLLFPSWIPHSVRQGYDWGDGEERISLAFTVMFKSNVKTFTTKLNYF